MSGTFGQANEGEAVKAALDDLEACLSVLAELAKREDMIAASGGARRKVSRWMTLYQPERVPPARLAEGIQDRRHRAGRRAQSHRGDCAQRPGLPRRVRAWQAIGEHAQRFSVLVASSPNLRRLRSTARCGDDPCCASVARADRARRPATWLADELGLSLNPVGSPVARAMGLSRPMTWTRPEAHGLPRAAPGGRSRELRATHS